MITIKNRVKYSDRPSYKCIKLGNEIHWYNERFNIESKKESINTVDIIFEENTNFEEIL